MKISFKTALPAAAVALSTALLLAQNPAPQDEKTKAKAERKAKDIARTFEQNAGTLTLFDRQGKKINTIGGRALYGGPMLSPDGKLVAYNKPDLEKETQDLWVMELATGNEKKITSNKPREGVSNAVWSPDGAQIAYTGLRDGTFSIYRKSLNADAPEELLYKVPGVASPTSWSADGRYLSLSSSDLGGGTISALPLDASDRKPIEVFHSPKQIGGGRLSPDGRWIAYLSNETGRNEIYVRAFNPGGSGAGSAGPWKISEQGGLPMTSWRSDGKEFYFMGADRSIMVVAVNNNGSALEFGKPSVLFRPDAAIAATPGNTTISSDGERVLIAVPPPQLRQLTIFDRQGKPVRTVGEPAQFVVQPHFSPDGTRLVYMKQDPKTSDIDIWTYDLESGKEYAVTRDNWPENAPIWAPDGKRVFYASTRESYAGIYRRNWDGTGEEELVFRYTPGAGIVLTDSSPDQRFLVFYTGVLVLVPLTGTDPLARKSIDWLRDEYDNVGGKFSPDGRYLAYLANVEDPMALDVYVRPFDPSKPEAAPPGEPVQISKNAIASGMIAWRADGKELYFMTRDWEIMAVDVSTSPAFQAGTPKLLFKLPAQPIGNALQWSNVSRDGQRFVFSMPAR